jgi:hypothetical protein
MWIELAQYRGIFLAMLGKEICRLVGEAVSTIEVIQRLE